MEHDTMARPRPPDDTRAQPSRQPAVEGYGSYAPLPDGVTTAQTTAHTTLDHSLPAHAARAVALEHAANKAPSPSLQPPVEGYGSYVPLPDGATCKRQARQFRVSMGHIAIVAATLRRLSGLYEPSLRGRLLANTAAMQRAPNTMQHYIVITIYAAC